MNRRIRAHTCYSIANEEDVVRATVKTECYKYAI